MKEPPDNILELTVAQLDGHWLELFCQGQCSRIVQYPFKLMAMEGIGHHRLGPIIDKLRCKACGQPPARILVAEDIVAVNGLGGREGWQIRIK